ASWAWRKRHSPPGKSRLTRRTGGFDAAVGTDHHSGHHTVSVRMAAPITRAPITRITTTGRPSMQVTPGLMQRGIASVPLVGPCSPGLSPQCVADDIKRGGVG